MVLIIFLTKTSGLGKEFGACTGESPKFQSNSNQGNGVLRAGLFGLTQFGPIRASFSPDFDRSEARRGVTAKLSRKLRVSAPGRLPVSPFGRGINLWLPPPVEVVVVVSDRSGCWLKTCRRRMVVWLAGLWEFDV
jgi:hypothetical protein